MSQGKPDTGGGSGRTNRLSKETSPYLLQHAQNPVDWYPWGSEALERSRTENKPILLSIGYAACHWCHVMAHESFEDESTAELMNESFVNIKVDREERPDLDEIYMKAVQMMSGHGGWPMTVFLTPNLKPFFGGTYFPPEDRHGIPAFRRVLEGVGEAWSKEREKLEHSSEELTRYLRAFDIAGQTDAALDRSIIDEALERIIKYFDRQWGGLGTAPKFPHCSVLELAMRCAAPSSPLPESRRTECQEIVSTSLDRMAYGGIHDQIGGGFARYSVDRQWLVPHFEKMLYDNAMLAQAYLDGLVLTGREYWGQVARDTLDFVLRELSTADGAFYSSLDADSEGEEGKFYVWTPAQIIHLLGIEDGTWVNTVYGVTPGGHFEHDTSVLHLSDSPEQLAEHAGTTVADFWKRLRPLNEKLLSAREKRIHPGRDEKVLTSWNGMMISAFVKGYKVLREERYLEAAEKAMGFILSNMHRDGRLLRTWGKGQAKLNGYLDDYACVAHALLDLAEVSTDSRWFLTARQLVDSLIEHFWDDNQGGFFYTSDDHEELVTRPKSYFDGSTPSGTSVATTDMLRLAVLTGEQSYMDKAETVMRIYTPHVAKMPDQFANLLCGLDRYLSPSTEIALIADVRDNTWREIMWTIHQAYLPNKVMLSKPSDHDGIPSTGSPLLADRPLVDGRTTVYICHEYACDQPLTDIENLRSKLKELSTTAS